MALLEFGSLLLGVLNKIFPDQSEIKKADIQLKIKAIDAELQAKMAEYGLLTKQTETNTAEASNPNRKWITWREMIGYACASALWWFWILQPLLIFVFAVAGHPIDPKSLPQLEIMDILIVVGGMLGIPLGGYIASKVQSKGK